VAGGHAARIAIRIAAKTAVSGTPAASSATTASTTMPTAIAACARVGRHGRKGHEADGNPLHSFHFCFPKSLLKCSDCTNGTHLRRLTVVINCK